MSKPRFLFLDVETTGLDTDAGVVEIGLIATEASFNELETFNMAIQTDVPLTSWSPWCLEQHNKSGLLGEILKARPERAVGDAVLTWLQENRLVSKEIELAGASVHFDIPFLNRLVGFDIDKQFSHRYFDVSAIRTAAKLLNSDGLSFKRDGDAPHRALADLRIDIADAKLFMEVLKRGVQ